MKAFALTTVVVTLVAILAGVAFAGSAGDDDLSILGNKRSVVGSHIGHKKGKKGKGEISQFECTATSGGANTNLDCDDPFPNNEPDIEVDPTNPLHMVASSNDYGSCCDEYYTTFDGGGTWSTGNMSTEKATSQGPIGSDPVTVFDRKHGMTLHASLNFFLSDDFAETCDGDVVVSPSKDGGINWSAPAVVSKGEGCDLDKKQVFNDKEWIVADNNPSSKFYGRVYVTWTAFVSKNGEYQSSAIFESHSDDGGKKWSKEQSISGRSKKLCSFQVTGHEGECDENQFSVPTIGPDGTVYVAFENAQNESLWESPDEFDSQYLLVSSKDGGKKWTDPSFVVGLEDGVNDYPLNADGRQTLTGYQVRVNSAGNIVAGPSGALYLTFSDNRNGTHDAASPVTNTDVFVMGSNDGGKTWTTPSNVGAGAGDQWFPWVEVNPANGQIGIVYNDRGASNGTPYNAAIAEGMLGFPLTRTTVSTAVSNPVESEFFQAEDPACLECAVFHGDYINVGYGSDGHANIAWTDMSVGAGDGLFSQFIFFARK